MPFQSEKQRRYLWANEPEIARDWTDRYGAAGGGIMRIPLWRGGDAWNFIKDKSGYTQHNINNELLKDALKAGKINEQQYKLMGGYDVAQQLPAGVFDVPAVGIASGAYQLAKKGAGGLDKLGLIDDTMGMSKYGQYGGAESMDLNMAGAAGLNPTDLQLYGSIINDTYGTGPAIMEREKLANINEDRRTGAMKLGEGLYNLTHPMANGGIVDLYRYGGFI